MFDGIFFYTSINRKDAEKTKNFSHAKPPRPKENQMEPQMNTDNVTLSHVILRLSRGDKKTKPVFTAEAQRTQRNLKTIWREKNTLIFFKNI